MVLNNPGPALLSLSPSSGTTSSIVPFLGKVVDNGTNQTGQATASITTSDAVCVPLPAPLNIRAE
jgi:hypothetical protein